MSGNIALPIEDVVVTIKGEYERSADFISFFYQNKKEIDSFMSKNGAVKFSGVPIDSLESFQTVVDSISTKFLNYIDGNSPRTKLSGNVYTSTEYDKRQRITMHNELSYSALWPNTLFFSCLVPAETGGETLLADSRVILQTMDKGIVNNILKRGITYIRNLHSAGQMGMGPTWQDTFETEDKALVTGYCRQYNMDFTWQENDSLRLLQKSRGIIEHHITGEKAWFNQIDQFHPCHLGEDLFETMGAIYGSTENFPMYVKFSDGEEISEDMVHEILENIDKVTLFPAWSRNELLMVDNELIAHGRNFYTGDRKVLVSMSK